MKAKEPHFLSPFYFCFFRDGVWNEECINIFPLQNRKPCRNKYMCEGCGEGHRLVPDKVLLCSSESY